MLPSIPIVRAKEQDSWATMKPLPMSSWDIVGFNDKIYAIAGSGTFNNKTYSNTAVLEFDPQENTWTVKNPMPFSRNNFATAVYKNKIYVIGGLDGVNQVYDPSTDTWETKTPMPTPRKQLNAHTVNGKIYFIGGRTGGQYSTVDLNEVYDPETDSWTTKTPIPYPVVLYASVVFNNKIFIIGGQDEYIYPGNLDTVQIYNPANDTWSFGTPMSTLVFQAVAGATSGKLATKRIYVIGGLLEKSLIGTNINQVYNPENDSWTTGAFMPTARFNSHIAVVQDKLYVMGGLPYFNVQGDYCFENEEYTPIGYGTNPQPTPSSSLPPESESDFPIIQLLSIALTVIIGLGILAYSMRKRRTK